MSKLYLGTNGLYYTESDLISAWYQVMNEHITPEDIENVKFFGIEREYNETDVHLKIRDLLISKQKIKAVKEYKEYFGTDLLEAVNAINNIMSEMRERGELD